MDGCELARFEMEGETTVLIRRGMGSELPAAPSWGQTRQSRQISPLCLDCGGLVTCFWRRLVALAWLEKDRLPGGTDEKGLGLLRFRLSWLRAETRTA